jgi:PX-associated
LGFHNALTIDSLLDKEDVALEAILDEDDLIQECKAQNTQLIDYFGRVDVLHMAAVPKDFYSQKLQLFVAAIVSRNLSSTSVFNDTDTEQISRKKTLAKIERNLSFLVLNAIM